MKSLVFALIFAIVLSVMAGCSSTEKEKEEIQDINGSQCSADFTELEEDIPLS